MSSGNLGERPPDRRKTARKPKDRDILPVLSKMTCVLIGWFTTSEAPEQRGKHGRQHSLKQPRWKYYGDRC
ncbi:hypothetical protein AALO_G00221440 [Alosa alosa]|uniref:Uncharacterized protein n=1 Tax=Alosa alosa TaxID=278164 RepID=A0AAV6G1A0_9TELE|nr:hypothetical protein AALO_G00221440 [Alosa alosa]